MKKDDNICEKNSIETFVAFRLKMLWVGFIIFCKKIDMFSC